MHIVQWLAYVLNDTRVPQTISTSYGDDEQTGQFRSMISPLNPVELP